MRPLKVCTSSISGLQPEGLVHETHFEKDPDLGVVWGNHPGAGHRIKGRIKDMVQSMKDKVFAYSVEDLGYYTGEVGAFRIACSTMRRSWQGVEKNLSWNSRFRMRNVQSWRLLGSSNQRPWMQNTPASAFSLPKKTPKEITQTDDFAWISGKLMRPLKPTDMACTALMKYFVR